VSFPALQQLSSFSRLLLEREGLGGCRECGRLRSEASVSGHGTLDTGRENRGDDWRG
jgi:hypothetical protein